jgi:RNA polymerase sigma-70 factor, ECF subfamily
MAGPVFGRRERANEASVVALDRDRALVEAARRDPSQFDALYRKYLAQVYAYALYELGDHHAAEDATERVFLRALAAIPGFREQASFDAAPEASTFRVWLFRIARNVVANERRSRRRRPAHSLEAALGAGLAIADATDIEAEAVTRDEAGQAIRALRALPDDRRRALTLRFVDEMSTAEIAGVLGRSEGAVRVLIHRALGAVARELGHERGLPAARTRSGDADRADEDADADAVADLVTQGTR